MHHRTLKNDGQWNPIYIKYGALMIFGALKIQTPVVSHGATTTLLFFVDWIIG